MIFIVNQIADFLSPYDVIDDDIQLPINENEKHPFIRKLPEFQFSYNVTRIALIALFCTYFKFLNIPADKRILIPFAFVIIILAVKDRINHMVKYHYVPWKSNENRQKSNKEKD